MKKRTYKFKLYKFTKKHLLEFKEAFGFDSFDLMLQWFMLYPDKVKLKDRTQKKMIFDKKYREVLKNATKERN